MNQWLKGCQSIRTRCRVSGAKKNVRVRAIRLSLLRPSDVMLASYPRSGNTWLRYLLGDILLQKQGWETATRLPIHPDRLIPDFDRGDDLLDVAFDSATTRCIKTHLPWCDAFGRAIVIFRKPADSLASYYHFQRRYTETRSQVETLGIDRFCLQQVDAWLGHLESYLDAFQHGLSNIHFVTYEQLHDQPIEALRRVSRLLGLVIEDSAIERAIENHRFNLHARDEACNTVTNDRFFRRGQVNASSSDLLPQTLDRIQERCESLYQEAAVFSQDPPLQRVVCSTTTGDSREPSARRLGVP